MPAWGELLVLIVCIIGIVGTIVPILPGDILVGAAVLVWALAERTPLSWVAFAGVLVVLAVGHLLTWLIPGRRMRAAGTLVLALGGVVGIAGFFLVPVVGLPLGFVLGVFAAELLRVRSTSAAWTATKEALKGTGLSVLIGFTTAVLGTALWAAVAVTT